MTSGFGIGLLAVAAASVFGIVYALSQRQRTRRRLAEEKAKSALLLRRIEADLERAARIQADLLPGASPAFAGFDIAGLNVPCYEIGGDYFDFVRIDDDRLAVVIADVSGKGISAALHMAALRAALLAEVRPGADLGRLAARLSDFVFKSTDAGSFVTFFYGELDRRTGDLRYVNAGHVPPLLFGRKEPPASLASSGFALGMFPAAEFEPRAASLEAGGLAVLFTDGIPEGRNASGEEYSAARLEALVRANRDLPAAALGRRIVEDAKAFACGCEPCDDMTVVVVKRA